MKSIRLHDPEYFFAGVAFLGYASVALYFDVPWVAALFCIPAITLMIAGAKK